MTTLRTNDNGTDRNMTEQEITQHKTNIAGIAEDLAAQTAALETAVALKTSAQNKLKALGLTDAEIGALVG